MMIENKLRVLKPATPEAVEPDEMQQARCLALKPEELRRYPHLKDKSDEELMEISGTLLLWALAAYRQFCRMTAAAEQSCLSQAA